MLRILTLSEYTCKSTLDRKDIRVLPSMAKRARVWSSLAPVLQVSLVYRATFLSKFLEGGVSSSSTQHPAKIEARAEQAKEKKLAPR